ncbi:MAG: MFS transporter [Brevefilum sp.]|nr:MFS transporter [Brevefilum sp.]
MKTERTPGFRTFLVIWFGQLISLTGSGLTGFAIGVWVFLETGSTTLFALIQLFTTLPNIMMGPISGALVDRWDRRKAMLFSDTGSAACTLIIFILLTLGKLELWHIYILLTISSSFATFQWPAYSAAMTLLVPKKQLGRANGLVQVAEGVAQILAPVTAGVLIGIILLQGVIMIDLATFLFAFVTLVIVRIPKPEATVEGQAGKGSILKEAFYGWKYIRSRAGLFALLVFFAMMNFFTSIGTVLFTPLVLSLSTPAMLGLLTSAAGLGFLAGSLLMSVWGGPNRKMLGIYIPQLIVAISLFILGSTMNLFILGVGAFLAFCSMPISHSCSQVIWQRKTAPDIQGRVFSFRRVIAYSSIPLAYLAAGPLADNIFNPTLVEGGKLAGSVGKLIGVGPSRGIGLIYILLGLLILITTVVGFSYTHLRHIEDELPDMIPETAPEPIAKPIPEPV